MDPLTLKSAYDEKDLELLSFGNGEEGKSTDLPMVAQLKVEGAFTTVSLYQRKLMGFCVWKE